MITIKLTTEEIKIFTQTIKILELKISKLKEEITNISKKMKQLDANTQKYYDLWEIRDLNYRKYTKLETIKQEIENLLEVIE
jgi:hypothetical protein